jgi:hypothetical protein
VAAFVMDDKQAARTRRQVASEVQTVSRDNSEARPKVVRALVAT